MKEFKTTATQLEDMFNYLQNGYHFGEVSEQDDYLTVWLMHDTDKELYHCIDMELV